MSGIMIHEGVYITRIRSVCGVCEGKWNTCGNWFHPSDAIMVFLNCMQQQAASLSGRAAQCQTTPNNVISKPSTSTAVINKALIDTLNRLQSAVCVCAKVCGMACSVSVWVCVCGGGGGWREGRVWDIIHHYHWHTCRLLSLSSSDVMCVKVHSSKLRFLMDPCISSPFKVDFFPFFWSSLDMMV